MCGRFTFFASPELLQQEFNLTSIPSFHARYNIAPTQDVFAVIEVNEKRRAGFLKWGLIPHWSKDKKIASKLINARAETIDSKPSFKQPFESKRCIIPSSGFYEWKKEDGKKQPYFIYPTNENGLFAFAGLWDKWIDENNRTIFTCTIITTEANEMMEPLHHRMPVILEKEDYSTWLHVESDLDEVKALLRPFDSDAMKTRPVSTLVNSPKNDTEQLLNDYEIGS